MNFVERQVGELAPRNLAASEAMRKWPIRYGSIEAFAICADLATILLASVLATLLYHVNTGWTATDIEKALGSAIVASTLFVCLLKINGRYRPTELLADPLRSFDPIERRHTDVHAPLPASGASNSAQ